jgi:primosomal protein N''
MSFGLPWSEAFIKQLADKDFRDEFVADQVRARIALMVRALREQADRKWSQATLGKKAGKPQNVISRIEDPNYGQLSLQTLLEITAAFDLPLLIDIPEWDDWLRRIKVISKEALARTSFDAEHLLSQIHTARTEITCGNIPTIHVNEQGQPDNAASATRSLDGGSVRIMAVAS